MNPPEEDWTVRASDYDAVANALRELMAALKKELPPGFYANAGALIAAEIDRLQRADLRTRQLPEP